MERDWKAEIIALTELPEARARKADALFFPPAAESDLANWEKKFGMRIPEDLRSFLLISDGLEAQKGEMWPVLPLDEWSARDGQTVFFGETAMGKCCFERDGAFLPDTSRQPLKDFKTYLVAVFRGDT